MFSYGIVYFPPKQLFKCGKGTMLPVFPRMKLKPYEPDLMNSNLNFVCLCIRRQFLFTTNTSSVNTFDILYRTVKHLLAQASTKTAYFSDSPSRPFSFPEAAFLLVRTMNRDLWEAPTPEVRDSRTSHHPSLGWENETITLRMFRKLDLPRGHYSWFWPKEEQTLGTRMPQEDTTQQDC